jgi:SHS2 domain-containing protein
MGWRLIDHPADMGVRVNAPDLPSLFREGALALAEITGASSADASEALEVSASGIDRVDLLVRWLQEVLYLIMVKDLRISGIEISRLTETEVHARVRGTFQKTGLAVEIKAVTYHNLDIVRKGDSFEASIIFDL